MSKLSGPGVCACVTCIAAWVLCAGCTLNGKELFGDRRRYFENEAQTGRSVMVDTWGINLNSLDGDAGLTLGRFRRTYFLPGPASTQPTAASEYLGGSEQRFRLKECRPFDWHNARLLGVRGRTEGLSLDVSMAGVGMSAGIRAFDALRLPADSNLWLLIKSGAQPDKDVFHVKEIQR
jgi:hypothetical protein